MGALPKEVVREIIKDNNFQNPGEILALLKDSFKDVLQEMLEAEMDIYIPENHVAGFCIAVDLVTSVGIKIFDNVHPAF